MTSADDFKSVFSFAFRDRLAGMSSAIDALEERFSQIEKSAADVQMLLGGGGDSTSTVFVELQSTGFEPVPVGAVTANSYDGSSFELSWDGQAFAKINESVCKAYDFSVMLNEPTVMPEPAVIEGGDGLEIGTVILGVVIAPGIVGFCSHRPRLQVTCDVARQGPPNPQFR